MWTSSACIFLVAMFSFRATSAARHAAGTPCGRAGCCRIVDGTGPRRGPAGTSRSRSRARPRRGSTRATAAAARGPWRPGSRPPERTTNPASPASRERPATAQARTPQSRTRRPGSPAPITTDTRSTRTWLTGPAPNAYPPTSPLPYQSKSGPTRSSEPAMYPSNEIDACVTTFPKTGLLSTALLFERVACRNNVLQRRHFNSPLAAQGAELPRRRFASVTPGDDPTARPRSRSPPAPRTARSG